MSIFSSERWAVGSKQKILSSRHVGGGQWAVGRRGFHAKGAITQRCKEENPQIHRLLYVTWSATERSVKDAVDSYASVEMAS